MDYADITKHIASVSLNILEVLYCISHLWNEVTSFTQGPDSHLQKGALQCFSSLNGP